MTDPIRLALFDCDGTLVDSQHAIVTAMAAAFEAFDLTPPDPMQTRRVIGLSLEDAVGRLLPDEAEVAPARVADAYRATFRAHRTAGLHEDPLFPGIREALDDLDRAGVTLGVVTGKSRRGLDAVLERHGLAGRFVTLQTADVAPGKPDPGMVLQALAETGADRSDTVVIGDTSFDMLMARAARARAVGVSWGYHHPSELLAAGADLLVDGCGAIPVAVLDLLDGPAARRATAVRPAG